MNQRGFSLIELVAVVGIAMVLGTVAFIYVGGRQGTSELDASVSQIVASLRQAQQNALASASSTPWGVHFDNTTSTTAYFALYASSTWSPAAEVSRASLSSRISYDTSSLDVGQTRDVLFEQGTGRVATTTSIVVRVNTSDRAYQIDISPSGLVEATLVAAQGAPPEGGAPAPTVAGINPNSGVNNAGVSITSISGNNFVSGATVKLTRAGQSDITGSGFSVSNATTITGGSFPITGAQAGTWSVVVTNPDAQVGTCTSCFTVSVPAAAPSVSNASPNSLSQGASSQNITLTGSNFVSGASVAFSGTGITVNNTTFNSATQLTVNISVSGGATQSARNVTVTNPDLQQGVCSGCFTVTAGPPTASGANPSSRGQGAASQNIVVSGSGFVSGANVTFSGTGITVNSTTFDSSTQLTANITIAGGATTGARNVTVTNPDAQQGVCSGCFTVNAAPTVASSTPATGTQGSSGLSLAVTGTGFASGAAATFSGTGITVNSTTFNSTTQVTVSVDIAGGATTGARNITVTNSDGGAGTGTGIFSVTGPAPTATSTNPASRPQGAASQNVIVNGTNFVSGANVTFSGTGITVNSTTFNSATQLTANVDIAGGATTGARNVTVTNPDAQQGVCSGCFTVNAAPTVASTNPNSGTQGASNLNVQVTGTGFASGAAATFSGTGITVNSTTFSSATQVTANITIAGGATTGARNVTVTNSDGGVGTGTGVFTVNAPAPPPTVSSPSPNTGLQGASNVNITISGSNFVNGAAATFSGTGITVNSTTFSSASSLTANITIAGGATLGARNITVTNPDAQQGSCSSCFTVTAAQTDTGYLLGSSAATGGTGTWTAPSSGTWFTDENPPTATTQVGQAAFTSAQAPTVTFTGFSFGIPAGASIDKICVQVNNVSTASSLSGTQQWRPSLTWDNGTNFTSQNTSQADITSTTLTGVEAYFSGTTGAPGTSDPGTGCTNWGRTWAQSETSSGNFGVRLTGSNTNASSRTIRFDVVRVKIYYTPQ